MNFWLFTSVIRDAHTSDPATEEAGDTLLSRFRHAHAMSIRLLSWGEVLDGLGAEGVHAAEGGGWSSWLLPIIARSCARAQLSVTLCSFMCDVALILVLARALSVAASLLISCIAADAV